jgi:UDP-N-acetylmuramoyl-tripeptide--D-alanyl-D-alanine ligase
MTNQLAHIYELYVGSGFKVCTDTRKTEAGSIFFALKGGNFNGNLFAAAALENGALYAVVDEKHSDDERLILVDDVLKCLQDLACLHRRTLGVKVLGIGGSNGKTTTKELIVSVLATRIPTHFTKGNLNNHIGVPLTLLQLMPGHEIAVIELGANKTGDIEELCLIAEPSLGIITNIGKEHLEGFGGMEGVAKAESELFDYLLKHNGHAFVNLDDAWLAPMGNRLNNKSTYGITHSGISIYATEPGIEIGYKDVQIKSVLMGMHNLQNIVAAISVAEYFNISADHIKKGIEQYHPANNRSQLIQTAKGNTVLLDAYNANPSSVEMALASLEKMNGFKVALLGDMFELGAYEASEHQHIADLAHKLQLDQVILVGKAFSGVSTTAGQIKTFTTKEEAFTFVRNEKYRGCSVLIKGSRGMKMEDFLAEF